MLNTQKIDWSKHLQNLENWTQPITEYAKIHSLRPEEIYWRRSKNKKHKKTQMNHSPKKEVSQFIPIALPKSGYTNDISLKITKNETTFEVSGLNLSMIKELISI